MTNTAGSTSGGLGHLSESIIRDELAKRLDLIEPDLTLSGVEFYLPSEKGARGFVDIVARDRNGMFVLIEIKRSTATSREAIQELLRYLALFVENHGIQRRQMRCVVVSTSWHELSAPFAEAVLSEAFQLEGLLLEVDANGIPIRTTPINPTPPSEIELHQPYFFECYEKAEQRDAVTPTASSCIMTIVEVLLISSTRLDSLCASRQLQQSLSLNV